MSSFKNGRKNNFIDALPKASLEGINDTLTERCKFNFSYFCHNPPGQNFSEWSMEQQVRLYSKLVEFSRQPLKHWIMTPIGQKDGNVLEIYGKFPSHSMFKHPANVPYEAQWGRFRLTSKERLVGFTIPNEFGGRKHEKTKEAWDLNTFYVVFLDKNHQFYPAKK